MKKKMEENYFQVRTETAQWPTGQNPAEKTGDATHGNGNQAEIMSSSGSDEETGSMREPGDQSKLEFFCFVSAHRKEAGPDTNWSQTPCGVNKLGQ